MQVGYPSDTFHRRQVHGLFGPDGVQPINESLKAEREAHGLLNGIFRYIFSQASSLDVCPSLVFEG